jgi:hypothetical protein
MKIFNFTFFSLAFILSASVFSASAFARTQLTDQCPNVVIKGSAFSASRGLYQLGLFHPAFAGFNSVLADPKESALAKQSAAECVRVLEVVHPQFKLTPAAVAGLLKSPAHKPAHRTLLTLLARGQLAPADYPKEFLTRKDDAAAVKLVTALKFAQKNPDTKALALLLPAVANSKNLPEHALFDGLFDLANLTAARLLYMANRNTEALEKTKAILAQYPSLPEAYELRSWIELALDKNAESVQDAITLRTPSLKNYFSPQTTLVPSIVFLEHCDYSNAKPHLSYFRVKYKNENEYLSRVKLDYYQDFVAALKQKSTVSPKIVANWVSSPQLMALLDEENLLLDETAETTRLHYVKLQAYLQNIQAKNSEQIRTQFSHLIYALRSDLNDAVQNAALIQVDVLLGVSKDMAEAERVRAPSSQKNSVATNSVAQPAKWSWEKKDTSTMENDEIWADEIGNLDVEINNKCK